MTSAKYNRIIYSACISILLLINIAYAGGLGVAPSEIHFSKVLRGGYSEVIITVTNPNEVPIDITFNPKGETKDLLSFFSLAPSYEETPVEVTLPSGEKAVAYLKTLTMQISTTNFTIPANSEISIRIVAKPPEDLPIGFYNGSITLRSKPQLNGTIDQFGTSIAVGVELASFLEITGEQHLDYEIKSISVNDAEENYPIEFYISGKNNGNVRVSPQVKIDILDRDKTLVLKSVIFDCNEVLPTTTMTDKFEISSENMSEGQYWVNVTIIIGGEIIKNRLLTFDIFAKGVLKNKGELIQISNKVWVNIGEIVKINALFKNTGERTTTAKFKGEVQLNGKIISVLESEELNVPVGETIILTTYFTPKEFGRYIVNGNVYYSKKITFAKESIINVVPVESEPEGNNLFYIMGGLLLLIIILIKYK